MGKVYEPFVQDEVDSLNGFQQDGRMHEFTCDTDSNHQLLVATREGWICPDCDYTQRWAHDWMANWGWRAMLDRMYAGFTKGGAA